MATLKNLVDETTNIKNELTRCYDNLRSNLTNKNIDFLDSDKLEMLIDKVSQIKTYKKVAGDEKTYISDASEHSSTETSEALLKTYNIEENFKSIRVSFTNSSAGSSGIYIKLKHIQDGKELSTVENDKTGSTSKIDIVGAKKGDKINIYGKAVISGSYASPCRFKDFKAQYSVNFLD